MPAQRNNAGASKEERDAPSRRREEASSKGKQRQSKLVFSTAPSAASARPISNFSDTLFSPPPTSPEKKQSPNHSASYDMRHDPKGKGKAKAEEPQEPGNGGLWVDRHQPTGRVSTSLIARLLRGIKSQL